MQNDVIQLSISIADRLVKNTEFLKMPESSVLKNISRSNCPGCQNKWRQDARLAVPSVMEKIVKQGNVSRLYNLLSGMYGKRDIFFRLPGTSKIVFNKEGMCNVRSSH